jgi:FAD/FMN-containing dehydrogenase
MGITVRTVTGDTIGLDEPVVSGLRAAVAGDILSPHDRGYENARQTFNAMIDRWPALIVRATGARDVIETVRFARSHGLLVAVRGGGHNVAGNAVCEGGIMLDLSPMTGVRVDPVERTARAEGGVTWRRFDRETQAFGLATTGGVISTTGIAGLTLGGGIGYLARLHGLTCDNLLSADIVTADGMMRTASATDHPDLFWAVRGGGGNFGVVTSFKYRLHPIASVFGGLLIHPLERAHAALMSYREVVPDAPDTLTCHAGLLSLPDGTRVVGFVVGFVGAEREGERAVEPLRSFGPPAADMVRPTSYVELQQMLDASYPAGLYHYWKSSFLARLSDDAIGTLIDHFVQAPSPQCHVIIEHLGGAIKRVRSNATAFYHRDMPHNLFILGVWTQPEERDLCVRWARDLWKAMQPFSGAGGYVNYMGQEADEGHERVMLAYGTNYPRLAEIKRTYDPTNFFRLNQNIRPGR